MSDGIRNRGGDGEGGNAGRAASAGSRQVEVLQETETFTDDAMLQTVLIHSPTTSQGTSVAGTTVWPQDREAVRQPEQEAPPSAGTEVAQRSADDLLLETIVADLTRLRRKSGSRHGGDP